MLTQKKIVTPFELVVKKFGKDFNSQEGALTLKASEVCDDKIEMGHFSRTHNDGWTIEGFILGDEQKFWVNEFMASHPIYLRVYGDFEYEVISDTEEGYNDFMKSHSPEEWDYEEI